MLEYRPYTNFEEMMIQVTEWVKFEVQRAPMENGLIQLGIEVSHHNMVSNNACAPMNGGIVNFMMTPDAPTGYPGWEGKIAIMLERPPMGIPAHLLKQTGLFIGNGGNKPASTVLSSRVLTGTGQIYEWYVRFYDSDFPALMKDQKEHELACLLEGTEPKLIENQKFLYLNESAVKRIQDTNTFQRKRAAGF